MHCMLIRNALRSQYISNCITDKSYPFLGCLCVYQLQFLADDRCSEFWQMCGEHYSVLMNPLLSGKFLKLSGVSRVSCKFLTSFLRVFIIMDKFISMK